MDKQLREKRVLQQDLRSAIARDEIELHYQPQAQIGGEITGFEALVRWHHPRHGLVPPVDLHPAGRGERAHRAARRMDSAQRLPRGGVLAEAAAASPSICRRCSSSTATWPRLVHQVLLETGLSPARLELEITEGVLIGDFTRAVSILRRLKNLGVRIAMDDFGTGYSSLSYLQSFPFDKIKIDQSLHRQSRPQPAGGHHHPRGDRARPRARSAGGGGRRRDRGTAQVPRRRALQRDPGLS